MQTVIRVEDLGKKYRIRHRADLPYRTFREELTNSIKRLGSRLAGLARGGPGGQRPTVEDFWALKGVGFEIQEGDRVGIIGRNGSGKTTLLKLLSRITEPTEGRISRKGRVGSLLEVGTGFHAELTGRENIFLNGAILGMSKSEIASKFDEIVAFSGVERFLDTPVKRYSSGMYVRLAFSVAAHLEPELLLVDEVLAVGDAQFQEKCLGKMREVGQEGRTVLFVSHNLGAIRNLCSRCLVLDEGRLIFDGATASGIDQYTARDERDLFARRWSVESAPKVSAARLLEVGFKSDGQAREIKLSTEKPIMVYIRFEVTARAKIGTTLLLYNSDGTHLFSSVSNHEPVWHGTPRPPGLYESVCEIPANLLGSGRYSVGIVLWQGHYEEAVTERNVIQFNAIDNGLVRGDLPYEERSTLVAPLLNWASERID